HRRTFCFPMSIPLTKSIPRLRLHRHPWLDALTCGGALVAAFLLVRLLGSPPQRLAVTADSTRFAPESAFALTRVLADSFQNRVTGTLASRRAAGWIQARFDALGLVTEVRDFPVTLRGMALRGRNVIARSGGAVPGAIVVLAHYDGQTTSGQSAGDDAAGVGVLMELARVLELHGHRRPITYVATDAQEWGSIGAASYVQLVERPQDIVAVISLDHVENGIGSSVHISGVGQGGGFAPLWLRNAAADAFAAGSVRTTDVGPVTEWFQRTVRLSLSDQGPFVNAGIPAVNLGVESRRPEIARFLYHTPGDRWETLRLSSFMLLGAGTERLVLALDRADRMSGPFDYLALDRDRMVKGFAILLSAIALFLPLALATLEAWQSARADPASRAAIRSEIVRAGSWWLIGVVGLAVLGLTVQTGMLPRYELYPATVRDPFLYTVRWGPVIVTVAALTGASLTLSWLRRRSKLGASHPLAGRATALSTLLALAAIALTRNPFAAVTLLMLPAWLWPWIEPTRRPLTGAASILVVLASAVPFLAAAYVFARHLEVGTRVAYYLFLQSAYGAWTPLTVLMFVVAVLAASRLVGTATTRPLPETGD
ncbi:MAG: M28 family peptidase, partial [Gemmatimonadales bacterium]|nr:M28 family peptidase [Gemmatimonadales bacterium]